MRRTSAALTLLALVLFGMNPAGPAQAQRDATLTVSALETNGALEPLGIDDAAPRFTWRLTSARRGVVQQRYRVLVATRAEWLERGEGDIWDSGTTDGADPWTIYAGPPLRSRTRYYWTVRVEAADRAVDAGPTWFETALFDSADWQARWIAGPARSGILTAEQGEADDAAIRNAGEFCRPVKWLTTGFAARLIHNNQGDCREIRPAPLLRKAFELTKPVARARLYASGLAYGHITLNGIAVSGRVLDPAFTNYSRTLSYTTDDVTGLLRGGENVVAAELGSGQYDSETRTWDWSWDRAQWRATPQLILQLHVAYEDGSEEVVVSDASWKVSVDGPRRYDTFYLGETYDARREITGWDRPGFDDSRWMAARIVGAPAGTLRAQAHEPIAIVSERGPGTRSEPSAGVFVYDVGQNLTGWAVVTVDAPAGTAVEIFYSEKLDDNGRASTAGNDLVFGQLQTDYYVSGGARARTWSPRFTYKGFRYVQVSAPDGEPLPPGVTVTVDRIQQVRSHLPRTSTFDSDHPTLNRIHRNTVWAIQNNLHGVITDTPVYEKNAWTGDAHLTAGTASLLFDTERLYRKMFRDMADAQTEQGEVSLLAPTNEHYGYVGKPAFKPVECCGATPAWDAFWFVIPWESYRRHGDRRALEATYPLMQRYLDAWIPQWTGRDGDPYAHTLTAGLGDWVAPQGVPTINALSSTAYYARMAAIAADVARALSRTDDAARYDALFERIRTDFNTAFLGDAGVYREPVVPGAPNPFAGGPPPPQGPLREYVHTAQILPLAFGLVPDERRASVAARLAEDILKGGGNAYVGVLGARDVLPALTAAGHHDAAFTVATQTDEPGWGYWTDVAGFTSLGEHWPADTRSRNHHMFGAIVQWFYEDLAGIRPLEPGYGAVEIRPQIPSAGLDRVEATYDSVRGAIVSRWRRHATAFELDVIVPPNTIARVFVPAAGPESVEEIGMGHAVPAARAEGVRLIGVEGDRVIVEVGSGRYAFRVRSP